MRRAVRLGTWKTEVSFEQSQTLSFQVRGGAGCLLQFAVTLFTDDAAARQATSQDFRAFPRTWFSSLNPVQGLCALCPQKISHPVGGKTLGVSS
jgi:hypothetical protein